MLAGRHASSHVATSGQRTGALTHLSYLPAKADTTTTKGRGK